MRENRKKVKMCISIQKKERDILRAFPSFASTIVSYVLEEFFMHVSITDLVREIYVGCSEADQRDVKIKQCIAEAFSATLQRKETVKESPEAGQRYWGALEDETRAEEEGCVSMQGPEDK